MASITFCGLVFLCQSLPAQSLPNLSKDYDLISRWYQNEAFDSLAEYVSVKNEVLRSPTMALQGAWFAAKAGLSLAADQLLREFKEGMYSTDLSKWMYNGNIEDRPSDMGYTLGHLITKSYFENAGDKKQAV